MSFFNELEKYGENTAIIESTGEFITYKELVALCQQLGEKVKKRTLVFSFCENSIGSLVGYLSFLNNEVVPVLIDKHMEPGLRENLLELYQPNYIYIPDEMIELFDNMESLWSGHGYSLLATKYKVEHSLYPNLALLLTTSGSTGSPKLVRQTYQNIQSNAESIAKYLKLDETERPITTLPMNYTYGLSIINSHLLVGATILMTECTLMQREFWEFFKKEKATSFGGVPYTYEMLKKLRFFRMDLPSLRTMTQAGGKLNPELHKEFAEYAKEKGKEFIVMYGQTEATARMAYLPADKALEKYGSMGIAIPGGKLELVDVDGKVIEEPEKVGELVYYGPNVTMGYAEKIEDLAKGDERQGKLETGDMAKRDAEGYFYIVGRKKRFLKIFGNRVNLDEIERMIKSLGEEGDCACSGRDDKLYVFLTINDEETQKRIKHFLADKTRLNPNAFVIKYIESIPKNEAGKVLYIKLEDYYDGI